MSAYEKDGTYLRRLGARVLSEANDLKRTPEALAKDLKWNPSDVARVIEGAADVKMSQSLLMEMAAVYPISLADIWIEPDDTDAGVLVMRSEDSRATSRIFQRVGRDGAHSDYYEYRDTAMSSGGPYKPEWIKELRFVDDMDPDNPDVTFNNGHLMHQMTIFIGEVNFYWIVDGKKYCRPMNTGDSCYITPFMPHSFTSRNPAAPGLIVAITFSSAASKSLDSLSRMDAGRIDSLTGDLRDAKSAFAARLARHREGESISITELAERMRSAGIGLEKAGRLAAGKVLPAPPKLAALAAALRVREQDLTISQLDADEEVVISLIAETPSRQFPVDTNTPAYHLTALASTRHQPGLKGFNLELTGEATEAAVFCHCAHEYIYNYADLPVALHWDGDRQAILNPGDSAYIRPLVTHRFSGPEGAQISVARVTGDMTDAVFDDIAAFSPDNRHRVIRETKQWF
ncbi:MAG: hypothetical protein HOB86_02225 [Rhodospirillaceae bacterium]|nr:hypothetical protein [Rhodospirillaceae bacterium]